MSVGEAALLKFLYVGPLQGSEILAAPVLRLKQAQSSSAKRKPSFRQLRPRVLVRLPVVGLAQEVDFIESFQEGC